MASSGEGRGRWNTQLWLKRKKRAVGHRQSIAPAPVGTMLRPLGDTWLLTFRLRHVLPRVRPPNTESLGCSINTALALMIILRQEYTEQSMPLCLVCCCLWRLRHPPTPTPRVRCVFDLVSCLRQHGQRRQTHRSATPLHDPRTISSTTTLSWKSWTCSRRRVSRSSCSTLLPYRCPRRPRRRGFNSRRSPRRRFPSVTICRRYLLVHR